MTKPTNLGREGAEEWVPGAGDPHGCRSWGAAGVRLAGVRLQMTDANLDPCPSLDTGVSATCACAARACPHTRVASPRRTRVPTRAGCHTGGSPPGDCVCAVPHTLCTSQRRVSAHTPGTLGERFSSRRAPHPRPGGCGERQQPLARSSDRGSLSAGLPLRAGRPAARVAPQRAPPSPLRVFVEGGTALPSLRGGQVNRARRAAGRGKRIRVAIQPQREKEGTSRAPSRLHPCPPKSPHICGEREEEPRVRG